jgi:hypothetical protein
VKLAAKMLMIAWTLMKKQERFDPKYLSAQTEPIAARQGVKAESGGYLRSNPARIVAYKAFMEAVFESLQLKRTLSVENTTLSYCGADP